MVKIEFIITSLLMPLVSFISTSDTRVASFLPTLLIEEFKGVDRQSNTVDEILTLYELEADVIRSLNDTEKRVKASTIWAERVVDGMLADLRLRISPNARKSASYTRKEWKRLMKIEDPFKEQVNSFFRNTFNTY